MIECREKYLSYLYTCLFISLYSLIFKSLFRFIFEFLMMVIKNYCGYLIINSDHQNRLA